MSNTTIDSITVCSTGIIEVRFRKRPIDLTSDDDRVRGWHCIALSKDSDVSAVLSCTNEALASMGALPINNDSLVRLTAVCAAAWAE